MINIFIITFLIKLVCSVVLSTKDILILENVNFFLQNDGNSSDEITTNAGFIDIEKNRVPWSTPTVNEFLENVLHYPTFPCGNRFIKNGAMPDIIAECDSNSAFKGIL